MKRIVLAGIVLLSFVFTLPALAQVQFGLRGGVNGGFASKPQVLGSFTPTFRPSVGPTGALFLDIPLGDYVSLRPELAYVQKGFRVREGFDLNLGGINLPGADFIGASVAYQSQHLELPLLLKVNMSDGPVQPYLIAGPAVGYALDGRVRSRATFFGTRTDAFDIDVNYGTGLNRWDVSAVGGLGLSMDAGAGKFFVEGRYTHGFTRQVELPVVNVNARNRGVAVSLGYSFPLGN